MALARARHRRQRSAGVARHARGGRRRATGDGVGLARPRRGRPSRGRRAGRRLAITATAVLSGSFVPARRDVAVDRARSGAGSTPRTARPTATSSCCARAAGDRPRGWHAEDLTAHHVAPRVAGDPRLVARGTRRERAPLDRVGVARHAPRRSARPRSAAAPTRFSTLDLTVRREARPANAVGDVAEVPNGTERRVRLQHGRRRRRDARKGHVGGGAATTSPTAPSCSLDGGDAIAGSPAAVAYARRAHVAVETRDHRVDEFVGHVRQLVGRDDQRAAPAGSSPPAGHATLPVAHGQAGRRRDQRRGDRGRSRPTTGGRLVEL